MTECSSCGAELALHETRCPKCGKTTPYYHRQRRCLHCGIPVAEQTKVCMMCHKPVDSLPLDKSIFSGSWRGILLGGVIIAVIVFAFLDYQNRATQAAQAVVNTITSTPTRTPTLTLTPTTTPSPTATFTATPIPTPTPFIHVIQSGETLLFIATQYNVTVEELTRRNGISTNTTLNVGQELIIPIDPASSAQNAGEPLPALRVYVIQEGDTISGIAYNNGTTIEAIEAMNPNVDLNLVFPGQEIVVPLSTPTPTATPTPLPSPTSTPRPEYPAPNLLMPVDEQVIEASTLLLNWTSTTVLAEDEFYVVELSWLDGSITTHWVKSNSLRFTIQERPANGLTSWTVSIRRQTGASAAGSPTGVKLSEDSEQRTFEWR